MRLAFFSQNACDADAIGGQLLAKVQAARAAGFQVRVFLSEGERLREELAALAVVVTPRELWKNPEHREFLLAADAVIVEFGGDYPLLDLLPALARRQQRLIFVYHGLTPAEFWPRGAQARVRAAEERRRWAAFAAEIWTTSDFTARELHEATGIPFARMRRLPCVLRDQPLSEPGAAPGKRSHLLFVGRLAPNKDVPTLLHAFSELQADFPHLGLEVIGADHDLYEEEATRCRGLARRLGIEGKVHFRGLVRGEALRGAYHRAAALVLPSRHEGFGMPLVEAMAAGVPVVCSDAAALPETAGEAALCFRAGDAGDLARRLRQILAPASQVAEGGASRRRVAVVSPRFGPKIVGGAERSLETMARALQRQRVEVEVFTTCADAANDWTNALRPGAQLVDGLPVHRFPIDAHDPRRLAEACERIVAEHAQVPDAVARHYLENSLGSTALVESLRDRLADFAAILVGPYLFRLTWQIASAFPAKTLLVPCFHDEPYAYLSNLRTCYRQVAGFLYHTATEQRFAERRLGMNHPRSTVVGTLLESRDTANHAPLPQTLASRAGAYLVYCGRFCAEKGVDELLAWSEAAAAKDPAFHLVLLGQGAMPLPRRPWLTNLRFVSEETKRAVVRNALALVNLSRNESLSIVLLEAWSQGIPVIGHDQCAVVRDQIEASQGGIAVRSPIEFMEAIEALRSDPALRQRLGESGQCYTAEHYQNPKTFAASLAATIESLQEPLAQSLQKAGRRRCQAFASDAWQPWFLQLLATEAIAAPRHEALQVQPLQPSAHFSATQGRGLLAVRLRNTGLLPITSMGLHGRFLWAAMLDEQGEPAGRPVRNLLPELLLPGMLLPATLRLRLPRKAGEYRLAFGLGGRKRPGPMTPLPLQIEVGTSTARSGTLAPLLSAVQKALAAAEAQSRLPLEYADVTSGWFAGLKRWLKQKLLHNFRKAYMEPLVRQQTQVNRHLLTALAHLAEVLQVHQQVNQHDAAENRENRQNPQASSLRGPSAKVSRQRHDHAHVKIAGMTGLAAEQEAPT